MDKEGVILQSRNRIFYNALLLTGVNLLLRLVGTGFQVYLSGRIGAEGIGLLQLTLSVGSMAMVAGMAGIRTATMYLTAEAIGKERPGSIPWVLSGCILYSFLCSGTVAAALYTLAPNICRAWIGDIQVLPSVRLFAVFLPVNCLTGVMVGYFTGANRIRTLAAVEVAEQLCSMSATVALLSLWAGHDAAKSCQSVILGSSIGGCMTLSCLVVLRLKEPKSASQRVTIRHQLIATAAPLAVADDLKTGINTVENLMVPKRLALYPGTASPLAAFGTISGMVFPVLMFPAAILFGLAELLIPEMARSHAAGHHRRIRYLSTQCLRAALLYGSFCAGILFLIAKPVCQSLYGSEDAGVYLQWFAPLAVMLYCDAITDAMVKGLGQQKISVRYNILTSAMDVIFLYLLLPKYGILGYFLSFLVTHAVNFLLSIRLLDRLTGRTLPVKTALLTLGAAALSVWAADHLSHSFGKVCAFSILLICLLSLSGIVRKDDIRWAKRLVQNK